MNTSHLLNRRRYLFILGVYAAFALLILALAPFFGSEKIHFTQVLRDLAQSPQLWQADTHIFIYQRLPRVLLGFLVGGALALVGTVLQVIMRNPLAAPSTLGLTGAGSVGAVLVLSLPSLTFHLGPFSTVQVGALLGCILAFTAIFLMARRPQGLSMNTLLLTGVTIGILCSALIPLIKFLADPNLLVIMDRWMMGGLNILGYRELAALFPFLVPGVGILLLHRNALNHLSLGEEMALGHGIDVTSLQRQAFLAGSLTVAACVSLVGPIFFVGLIVPHCLRRLSGFDHRLLLPASIFAGGIFLVLCDVFARTLTPPTEMPVGIITAIIGGLFFIYLLLKNK